MVQLFTGLSVVAAKYNVGKLVLTSGDRDCSRQLEISGPNSYHLNGNAFDAVIQPWNPNVQRFLGIVAETLGFRWGGHFAKSDMVHFDDGRNTQPGHCANVSLDSLGHIIDTIYGEIVGMAAQYSGPVPSQSGRGQNGRDLDVVYQASSGAFQTGIPDYYGDNTVFDFVRASRAE